MTHLDFCDPAVKFFLNHQNIELDDLVGVGGFFQVTPTKFPLFVSFKGILSKFSYVKPNPYYRLFFIIFKGAYVTSPTEICGGATEFQKELRQGVPKSYPDIESHDPL